MILLNLPFNELSLFVHHSKAQSIEQSRTSICIPFTVSLSQLSFEALGELAVVVGVVEQSVKLINSIENSIRTM